MDLARTPVRANDHEQASCATRTPDPVQVAACLLDPFGHAAGKLAISETRTHPNLPTASPPARRPQRGSHPPQRAGSNPFPSAVNGKVLPAPPSLVRAVGGGQVGPPRGCL